MEISVLIVSLHTCFLPSKASFLFSLRNILYLKTCSLWKGRRELNHYSDLAFEIFSLKYFLHFNLWRHRKTSRVEGIKWNHFRARAIWQSIEDTDEPGSQLFPLLIWGWGNSERQKLTNWLAFHLVIGLHCQTPVSWRLMLLLATRPWCMSWQMVWML